MSDKKHTIDDVARKILGVCNERVEAYKAHLIELSKKELEALEKNIMGGSMRNTGASTSPSRDMGGTGASTTGAGIGMTTPVGANSVLKAQGAVKWPSETAGGAGSPPAPTAPPVPVVKDDMSAATASPETTLGPKGVAMSEKTPKAKLPRKGKK